MKRCFKYLLNYCTRLINRLMKEEKVGNAIGVIIGIIVSIIVFVYVDKTPATASDYEPMEKQVIAIQQDRDLLLKTDCNISIENEVITVVFENDKCELTAKYDQNFEILSTSKHDKCFSWPIAIAISLISGLAAFGLGSVVVMVVAIFIIGGVRMYKAKVTKK